MKVYVLYGISRGYLAIPKVRAVYLSSKLARAEAKRLNESPYAGRQTLFVVKAMTTKG